MSVRDGLRFEIALRRHRESEFGRLPEAQWNMLTDLALCRLDGRRVYVTSACLASGVPVTTALRHVSRLEAAGLIERVADGNDGRRCWLSITDAGFARLSTVFGYPSLSEAA